MNVQELVAVVAGTGACCFGFGFAAGYRYWIDYLEGYAGRHRLTGVREEEAWDITIPASTMLTEPLVPVRSGESAQWLREMRERLASTGELRLLAEAGEVERLHAETAAWHALTQLEEWTR